jgi:replicative DNA helicase
LPKNPIISDTQAEAGIIATLIYNPRFVLHSDTLKHNHFYHGESACLYWSIGELVKQGVENIDQFNIEAIISSNDKIKGVFEKYSINLADYIDMSKNIARNTLEEYKILVDRVLALAYKRELHKQLRKYDTICLDIQDDNISKLSGDIYNTLNKLNETYILGENDIKPLSEELDDLWEEIINDSKTEGIIIQPKIPLIRNYFNYAKGEVIMLVARYKQGKSAVLMNEALYQAQQGHSVAYLDSEMKKKEFVIRALANLAQVEVRKIKQGSYTPSEELQLKEALATLK